jgi:hypothetical protein
MRRTLIGLAVALAVVAVAGPASAAPGQVTHFRFHGSFAEAEWFMSTDTSFTDTFINVSRAKQGSELFVDQFTANFDASGTFTGATDTFADVTSGFMFSIDSAKLSGASVNGSGLPQRHARTTPISISSAAPTPPSTQARPGPGRGRSPEGPSTITSRSMGSV